MGNNTFHNKSGSVFIGFRAGKNELTSNKLYIENSDSDTPLIWGDFDLNSLKINGTAHITDLFSVGFDAVASGPNSIAVGSDNLAFGSQSSAFGLGLNSMSLVSTAIGRYNIGNFFDVASQTNWVGTDPLFEIGNGTDDANRSNALTVLKNGDVSFGPMEGAGSKLLWNTTKSAFRVGSPGPNGAWDDTNIGDYSVALNNRTIAKGSNSFASGYQTEALGLRSTAMGSNTIASGLHSTAIGSSVEATGDYSVALGRYVRAAGNGTVFIGDNSVSSIAEVSDNDVFVARFDNGFRLYTSTT